MRACEEFYASAGAIYRVRVSRAREGVLGACAGVLTRVRVWHARIFTQGAGAYYAGVCDAQDFFAYVRGRVSHASFFCASAGNLFFRVRAGVHFFSRAQYMTRIAFFAGMQEEFFKTSVGNFILRVRACVRGHANRLGIWGYLWE